MTKKKKPRQPLHPDSHRTKLANFHRQLEDGLAGVIFGCTDDTYAECVEGGIFGLPTQHFLYVKRIKIGMPLFLFNYTRREMHGVFEAASVGQLDINPHGWTGKAMKKTTYPAQVRVKLHKKAEPLKESKFKPAIRANYESTVMFKFELDMHQVKQLCALFKSSVPRIKATTILQAPRTEPDRPAKTSSKKQSDVHVAQSSGTSWMMNDTDSSSDEEDGFYDNAYRTGRGDERGRMQRQTESQVRSTRPPSARSQGSLSTSEKLRIELAKFCERQEETAVDRYSESASDACPENTIPIHKRRTLAEVNGMEAPRDPSPCPDVPSDHQERRDRTELSQESSAELEDKVHCPEVFFDATPLKDDLLMQFARSKEPERHFTVNKTTDTLILLGGVDEQDCFSQMEVLQEDLQTWETSFLIPGFDFIDGQAVSIQDDIFILGGGWELYAQTRAMEMLRVGRKRWMSMQSMPTCRPHFATVPIGNAFFTIGGGSAYKELDICEWYSCELNAWQKGPSLQERRYGHAACVHDALLFVTGGGKGGTCLDAVEMLDDRTGTWQKLTPMHTGRKHHCCNSFKDQLWVLGGEGDDQQFLQSVESFDSRNQKWIEQPSLMHPRAFFTVEIIQDTLHAIGGAVSPTKYAFLGGEVLDCETACWKSGLSVGTRGRRGHHASCVIKGHPS